MKIEKRCYKNLKYYTACNKEKSAQPVLIHIHGAGSRGEDLDVAIESNPILKFMKGSTGFAFKVYSPQCYADTWFDIYEQLIDFIKFVKVENPASDIFLTGISMGGYCAWQLLASLPDFFKKAIICCGGGMYWNAGRIKTPVKAFHGSLDDLVFPQESKNMCEGINARGGKAELFCYDDLYHDCWTPTFSNEKNYEWLLEA